MNNREFGTKKWHFSVRKLTIGAVSVMLAASMYTALAKPITIHADLGNKVLVGKNKSGHRKIAADEILRGFVLGRSSVAEEYLKNNITTPELTRYHLNQDSPVKDILQWGMYFNYGSQMRPAKKRLLQNVHFYAYFSKDQLILPHSIKVYELPDQYVARPDGYRWLATDQMLTGGVDIYNWLTNPANHRERTDFEEYLRSSLKRNGFEIDQSRSDKKVPFYVPRADGSRNHHYAAHACFIQLDTKLLQA